MFNENDYKFFSWILLFFLVLAWLGFLLTLCGLFYPSFFVVIAGFFILFKFKIFLKLLPKLSKNFITVNIILFAIIALFSFYSGPSIFSGRDQGSMGQASVYLAKFHKLQFSTPASETFFEINSAPIKSKFNTCLGDSEKSSVNFLRKKYCEIISSGKALNFPGFYYTADGKLTTQFPLVYISWLAMFFGFFGIKGLVLANAVSFYLFVLSFLFLTQFILKKNKSSKKISIGLTFVILATSFSFMWFFKFNLTENLTLALLWSAILQTMFLIKKEQNQTDITDKLNLTLFFLSSILLIFTRIEGILFFAIMLLVILRQNKKSNANLKLFKKTLLFLSVPLFVLLLWNFIVDAPFYKAIAKAFLKNLNGNNEPTINNDISEKLNIIIILLIYGLLVPILIGLFQIFHLLKNKKYFMLIPFFVTAPAFVYLLSPQISPDHPWMLRRFVFAVLPVSILYTIVLLNHFLANKKLFSFLFFTLVILLSNSYTFIKFLTFRPASNLLEETKKLSREFQKNDLILVDKLAGGDGWQMIDGAMNSLFGKNAVYFFNPNDLKKINFEKYDNIYLIVPEKKISYYKNSLNNFNLIFQKKYTLQTNILSERKPDILPPNRRIIKVQGAILKISR